MRYKCLYCGWEGRTKKGTGQLDHLIPGSWPSSTDDDLNRAWACSSCNNVKHDKDPISFAKWLMEHRRDWKEWGKGALALSYFAKTPWPILRRRLPPEKYQFLRKWYQKHSPRLLAK